MSNPLSRGTHDQRHVSLHAEPHLVDRDAGGISKGPARDAIGSGAHALEIESATSIRHGSKRSESRSRVHRLKEDRCVGNGRAVHVKHASAHLPLGRTRLRSAGQRGGRWLDRDLPRQPCRIPTGAFEHMFAVSEHIKAHMVRGCWPEAGIWPSGRQHLVAPRTVTFTSDGQIRRRQPIAGRGFELGGWLEGLHALGHRSGRHHE